MYLVISNIIELFKVLNEYIFRLTFALFTDLSPVHNNPDPEPEVLVYLKEGLKKVWKFP